MRIFLDDERLPSSDDFEIYRNAEDLVSRIQTDGIVLEYVSFDHDLGEGIMTGYDLVKWIVNYELDGNTVLSDKFEYYVHSQNPIGKRNIETILDNYMKYKNRPKDR